MGGGVLQVYPDLRPLAKRLILGLIAFFALAALLSGGCPSDLIYVGLCSLLPLAMRMVTVLLCPQERRLVNGLLTTFMTLPTRTCSSRLSGETLARTNRVGRLDLGIRFPSVDSPSWCFHNGVCVIL